MTAIASPVPTTDSPREPRRFTGDELERMVEIGIIGREERVELIDGEIVCMAAMGPEHAGTTALLSNHFFEEYRGKAHVRTQSALRLSIRSQPEPDVAVVLMRPDSYRSRHPGPADAILVVEVAVTSLDADLNDKVPMYARAGIPETWVVALPTGVLHRFTDVLRGVYRVHEELRPGDDIPLPGLPYRFLSVGEILGAPPPPETEE